VIDLHDIQGIVVSGYAKRPAATFYLLRIVDVERARTFLGRLIQHDIQFADFLYNGRDREPFLKAKPVNVAFTFAGLRALGLPEEALAGFENAFREGLTTPHRARVLGDDGPSAAKDWLWGGPKTPTVHVIVCAYGGDEHDGEREEIVDFELSAGDGVELVKRLTSLRTPQDRQKRTEHFGYRDGIANPAILGVPGKASRDVIPTGEVLLGYENAYGRIPQTPRVHIDHDPQELLPRADGARDFGFNGSYVVFRQLAQDVPSFERFTKTAAVALGTSPDWVGARLIGRWKDGTPVTLHPDAAAEADHDDFTYHANEDGTGQRCPIGAHIRRSNPRDTTLPVPHDPLLCGRDEQLAREHEDKPPQNHRIVRRGRIYGERVETKPDDERGLHFICFNANLRRQFEFVQAQWVGNPCFAGLSRDPDPVLASSRPHPFTANTFTLQGSSGRPTRHLPDVPRLAEVRGGAYFFMPSRRALEYLAALDSLDVERRVPSEQEDAEADRDLHIAKITRDHEQQKSPKLARRAFHGKAHAIARATLIIPEDLPETFAHGIFTPGARYDAWVRFSNSDFTIRDDTAADIHGLAIKVMGVRGKRAESFEQQTQDFLCIDAPQLMVPNIAAAVAFDRAAIRGGLTFLAHLLSHPGELKRVLSMRSKPRHPLERVYSSVAPFRLGPHIVRWAVRRATRSLVAVPEGPDQLRIALREQLKRDGVLRLELCIELRGTHPRPIEDGDVDWGGRLERIADLVITADGFGTDAQNALGEKMSFNPWNALEAHRPLGNLNRARRVVYRAIYLHRSKLNGLEPFEPRPKSEDIACTLAP
jgi:Dyp-type peroxidase family